MSHLRFTGRFRTLADVYEAGRPDYPPLLVRRVAAAFGANGRQDVLDLGTGPGFLALAFEPYARHVVGIDPEPEMLRVAAAAAKRQNKDVSFLRGSSDDLPEDLGPFRLVTIGRAFHWMDRPATLAKLERIVDPLGGIALFSEAYPQVPANIWYRDFDMIVERYAADDPAAAVLRHGKDHERVLLESSFSHLERVAVLERRRTPLDRLVDRALSFARTSDGNRDANKAALARDVRAALEPHARDGVIDEVIEGIALIARRPESVLS